MTIAEMDIPSKYQKGRRGPDILIILTFLLSCSASFGLGMLAQREMGQGGEEDRVWVEKLSEQGMVQGAAVGAAELTGTPDEPAAPTAAAAVPAQAGKYVASKNGTKYYLPTCGTAKRIKDENKVWFASKEQAASAGYAPGANCPGL
jgi:hypothetical protein